MKTYQERDGKIVLVPHNASLSDMVFDPAEVQIFGKVVTVMRKLIRAAGTIRRRW